MVTVGGEVRSRAHRPVRVRHPRPGWVEQDAAELHASVVAAAREAMDRSDGGAPVAIGVANQRETLVVFDRRTLEPAAPAIVWQCRRSLDLCEAHRAAGEEAGIRRRTGLLLDPYFTATKIEWLLDAHPELRVRAERGELCAGTVDTWLIARFTGGAVIATDASNASRTLLHALGGEGFDAELEPLPAGVRIVRRLVPRLDVAVLFVIERRDLERRFPAVAASITPAGGFWVAWPKRASKVPTDITEDVIREVVLPTGLVDVKVCAVDDIWSGLKLVVRKELRAPRPQAGAHDPQ